MAQSSRRRNWGWYIAAIIIVIVVVAVAIVLAIEYPQLTGNPSNQNSTAKYSVTITIYSGEIGPSTYGFGNTSSTISSPGPSFTVKTGTKVTVQFGNAGSMAHNWALTIQKTDGSTNLAFKGAQIASGIDPVSPAGTGTCIFIADTPGTYYYICQVSGHVSLGMWGYFTVTS